jgi:hypothetical protein
MARAGSAVVCDTPVYMCAPHFEADLGPSRVVGLDGDDRGDAGPHEYTVSIR